MLAGLNIYFHKDNIKVDVKNIVEDGEAAFKIRAEKYRGVS
jgi:hypothetical protein